ncbi:hypothetical protein [Oleiharenicola sp. Vm1]|uniref:hypothetical protein n=1 Tax=Oleiharenicola sp. Vm1 TaxID=3398393 RepID=UPI0039F4FA7F
MKFLPLFFVLCVVASATDLRDVRFPFGDEKELSAFITATEPRLDTEQQRRVWRNGLAWMREHANEKKVSFWQWLRGMRADEAVMLGYITHIKKLSDVIESLAKEAREKGGEEAARLKARAAELSKAADALMQEVNEVALPAHKHESSGTALKPGA